MILFPISIPCATYKHVNTTESSLHSLCSYHCTTHYRKMSAESAIIKITIIRPTLNAQTQRHAHTKCANNLQYVSVKKKKKTSKNFSYLPSEIRSLLQTAQPWPSQIK